MEMAELYRSMTLWSLVEEERQEALSASVGSSGDEVPITGPDDLWAPVR